MFNALKIFAVFLQAILCFPSLASVVMPTYGNTPPILLAQNNQDRIVAPSTITRTPISPVVISPQNTKEAKVISAVTPPPTESIRLPGNYSLDVGVSYIYETNNTIASFQGSSYPGIGATRATLNWDKMTSDNIELSAKLTSNKDLLFAKGSILLGKSIKTSGQMQDTDYAVNDSRTFGDTLSDAQIVDNTRFIFDIGKSFKIMSSKLEGFVGYFYSKTKMDALGFLTLPVQNNTFYNDNNWLPGQLSYPNIVGTTYQTIIEAPRIGVSYQHPISHKQFINSKLVFMPSARMTLNDWHRYSTVRIVDENPNLIAKGLGGGFSADFDFSNHINKNMRYGLGIRYTYFSMGAAEKLSRGINGDTITPDGLTGLSVKNFGLLFNFNYGF